MAEPSQKALKILEYIGSRAADGVPPSVREICAAVSIKSTSTVHKLLRELEEHGLIQREQGLNRSIKLPGEQTVRVPILGTVTAGAPILAIEEIEGYIPYTPRGINPAELFALRVRGESMINAGILDGDLIVACKTPTAENGQIVVVLLEDEATVKRFYRENGRFRLQPENDSMKPIYSDSLQILGRVVSVMRFYE